MTVKRSQSGTRILAVLERIAEHQPIGVSDLARLMEMDKSALQRAIMTLADEGWVRAAPGPVRRWELTGHIHLVAHMAQSRNSLRQRARPALAALRDATNETAALTVPDIGRFIVLEVEESRQMLRTAPHVGMAVIIGDSATGRAVLPYLPPSRQEELFGGPVPESLRARFAETLERGYAVSEGDHEDVGSINFAAPIFETGGVPVAAVLLSAPRSRLRTADHACAGAKVLETARAFVRAAGCDRADSGGIKGEQRIWRASPSTGSASNMSCWARRAIRPSC